MSQNVGYLQNLLCRRIANGSVSKQDLELLNDLMACQRRRYMMIGMGIGVLSVTVLGIFAMLVR